MNQGLKHDQIAEILGLSEQKMHYLMKIKIKTEKKSGWKKWKKKLDKKYIDKIFKLAKDKTTSEMSSKLIASIINSLLEKYAKEGKDINNKIHFSTVFRYKNS